MNIQMKPFQLMIILVTLVYFSICSNSTAQNKDELPEVEVLSLKTKDGVNLSASYFASNEGKKAPPIILVHDWEGSSKDFLAEKGLAKYLQSQGYAVIVPDLRGHGKSLELDARNDTIDLKKFRNADFLRMTMDIEACKKHLMKENNQGKLNIELLSVLAIGKSTLIATTWAVTDWSFPPLRGIKQGQDVKALILVSPVSRFKGLSLRQIIKAPVLAGQNDRALPIFLIAGVKDATAKRDTKQVQSQLERSRGSKLSESSLVVTIGSNNHGAEFANFDQAQKKINQFIELMILAKAEDLRWQNRDQ